MWGWVYGFIKAISETLGDVLTSAPPKSVGTDVGRVGSAARFMQRVRAGRNSRASTPRDEDSDTHS